MGRACGPPDPDANLYTSLKSLSAKRRSRMTMCTQITMNTPVTGCGKGV